MSSADDFRIDVEDNIYTYLNVKNSEDSYFELNLMGGLGYYRIAYIKSGNIPDAPVMEVYLDSGTHILLPKSVDCWDISFCNIYPD